MGQLRAFPKPQETYYIAPSIHDNDVRKAVSAAAREKGWTGQVWVIDDSTTEVFNIQLTAESEGSLQKGAHS